MNTRTLGKTGLQVSELGLGGLFVSSYGAEFEQGRAAVHRALQLGVNYIDTAPTYANSEEVLGRVLEDIEQPVIISTKLGGRPTPFLPQDKTCLMQSVEESLRLLKRDTIDLLMIHEPDRPGEYDWWSDRENYTGPVLEVLNELKSSGVVRFSGIGGTTPYEMANVIESGHFDVVLTAFNYSLLWREAEQFVLPAATKRNMGIIIGSPLQQGALSRRYDDEVRHGARWLSPPRRAQYLKLYELLDEVDIPLPELALRFILSNPNVSSVLMGARSVAEVEQNVAAIERGPLPQELIAHLDAIAAMVPFRPFDEPAGLPFGREYQGAGRMR
jgi:aryl-alcohol dehydrogenase-like predicted oxidoreductase